MGGDNIPLARIEEYEAQRAAIKNRYTPRLKALSAGDPQYAEVWNARAEALRVLAAQFAMPAEAVSR
jgi:hypothetical protein